MSPENVTAASPNISVEGSSQNTSENGNEKLHADGGVNNSSNSIENESNKDLGTEKKLKKRTFRVPLKVQISLNLTQLMLYLFQIHILYILLSLIAIVDDYRLLRRQSDLECPFQKNQLLKLNVSWKH